MLKGIPKIISPELLKVLAEMGHSDTIVIADANFPAESIGRGKPVIRADGHGATELLSAILTLFPLDTYVDCPVKLMAVMDGDNVETPIWEEYKKVVKDATGMDESVFCEVERFAFYEKANDAYAIIATGESALYANIILQKGVI